MASIAVAFFGCTCKHWQIGQNYSPNNRQDTFCRPFEELTPGLQIPIFVVCFHNTSFSMLIERPKIQLINKNKDVGICTSAHPVVRPSHCPHFRMSNAASPRQDEFM